MSPVTRMSADERREAVLDAAMIEFGLGGYVGTSTESIARRVGVSQPYLFRLFPSKKAIFLAAVERCFDRIQALFETAAEGLTGDAAMSAMGYGLQRSAGRSTDPSNAAPDVGHGLQRRRGPGRYPPPDGSSATVERLGGLDEQRLTESMAYGKPLNVMGAMDIERVKDQLGPILAGLAQEHRPHRTSPPQNRPPMHHLRRTGRPGHHLRRAGHAGSARHAYRAHRADLGGKDLSTRATGADQLPTTTSDAFCPSKLVTDH